MKFATCNEYFEDWKIEEVFDFAAEIGYDGVEIAPFTIAPSVEEIGTKRRQEIRHAAATTGVEIVGLHWLLASPEGLYVNHPDERIRSRTRDYFNALIHFCGDLGGRVMIIGSPKQRNVQEGWDFQETWDRMRGVFEVQIGKKGYPAEWVPHLAQAAFDLMVETGVIDLSVLDDEQRDAAIAGGHSRVRH